MPTRAPLEGVDEFFIERAYHICEERGRGIIFEKILDIRFMLCNPDTGDS
jgi:hypothetical protein